MKKSSVFYCATVLILSYFYSCDDILEDDISDNQVITVSPTEGQTISGEFVNFQWQALDGADQYRVLVSDNEMNNLTVIDSLVVGQQLGVSIGAGSYNWTIRGENFGYVTGYSIPQNFEVVFSDDLTNQQINLSSPSDLFYTNDPDILLTWEPNNAALTYNFELLKDLNGITTISQESNIIESNFTPEETLFDEDAQYIWRIQGVNENSQTAFFERSLFIDRVVPNTPILIQPDNQEDLDGLEVFFEWSLGQDTGTVQSDLSTIVQLSLDTNFTQIIDTIELTTETGLTYTFSNGGVYYWRVQLRDLAGNLGDYSQIRTFTLL